MSKRVIRIFGIGFLIAALLVVGGVIFLQSSTAKRIAFEQIQKILRQNGVVVEGVDFSYSLLALRVSIGHLSVSKVSAPDLPKFLAADNLTASIGLRNLIAGRYWIEDLVVTNPNIQIAIDEKGRTNIPGPETSPAPSTTPINWLILKMRSTGGSFTLDDRSRKLMVRVTDWDVAVDGSALTGTEEIQFKTKKSGEARYDGKTLAIQNVDAHVSFNQRTSIVDLHDARLVSDIAETAIKGTVNQLNDPGNNPILDLKTVSTIHLQPARPFLSITQKLDGDLHVDASVSGRLNQLKVAGHANGRDLTAEMINQIEVATDFAYDIAGKRARLSSMQGKIPGVSVRGAGDLALARDAGKSTADIQIDFADLEKLSKTLQLPIVLTSRATGKGRAQWTGLDFDRMDASAGLQLSSQPTATYDERIPVDGALMISAHGGNLNISTDSVRSGALTVAGQVTLQSYSNLGGALRVDTPNVGQALIQSAGWSGTRIPPELHLSGAAGADVNLGGTLKRPQIGAMLQAKALQLNELKNIDLDAVAEYTPDQIDIQNVGLRWEGESLTGSGKIGLSNASPSLDAALEVSNASVHRILAALGKGQVPAEGTINVTSTISGTIQAPTAVLNLSASGLQAYGEPIGTLSAAAHIENKVVLLDRLTLSKEQGGQLLATGRYETTTGKYDLKVEGNEIVLSHLAVPQGPIIGTIVNFSANGSGTAANPGGTMRFTARDLQINNEKLGAVEMDANVADHRAKITTSAPAYGITANATVATLRPYLADIEVRASDADISRFPVEQLKEFSGRVTATIHASGDLNEYRNAEARASVQSLNLSWRNHAISSDGSIDLQYAKREVKILNAALRLDDSTLTVSGNVPIDAGSIGEIKIGGRSDLASLSSFIPSNTPIMLQGQLAFDGRLRGNLKRIDPEIAISITEGSFASSALPAPVTGIAIKATAGDGRLTVGQLEGDWAGAKINVQGEAPFSWLPQLPFEIPRPPGASRLSVDVQQFKLSALVQPPPDTDGNLSLKVEATAANPVLDSVQATVTLDELQFHTGTYTLEQVGKSTVELRNSIATVRQFELTGPETKLRLAGTANLRDSGSMDLKLDGATDVAVLALFSNVVRATGSTTINIAATGTARKPILNGFVELQNGQALVRNPRIAAENLQMRLDLAGSEIRVTRLDGLVNGGSIKGEGNLKLFGSPSNASDNASVLTVTGDGVFFEFPEGVKTVSNARLSLNGDSQRLILSGNIDVLEGTYTDPITLDRGLLQYLESEQSTTTIADEQSLLSRTQFNVALRTLEPLLVDNNIARGEINMELRLLGTMERPGLTGRIDVGEGAELNLRERKYSVDRGVITFINERAIQPILDVEAVTIVKLEQQQTYTITMQVTGDATRKPDTVLTSDPPLPEADIVSILATGRTLEKASVDSTKVAQEQVLSYVAGELGTSFTEGVGRSLGLSQVRIEPSVLATMGAASEVEPTARLTLGKDLTSQLNFLYSMDLRNSSNQTWIADYDITRRFSTRGIRQDDGSFRLQFQHEVLFGLSDEMKQGAKPIARKKIGTIQFSGETHFTMERLSKAAGLKTGNTYDFLSVQKARQRLEKVFAADSRLEAQISVDRNVANSIVDLTFRIKEGPKLQMEFTGWNVPADLGEKIRNVWSDGVIDAQRIADVTELIQVQLVKDLYLGSRVECIIETPDPDTKKAIFKIRPGVQFNNVPVEFEGVTAIPEEDLRKLLKDAGFFDRDLEKRNQAVQVIEREYQNRGYVDIKVDPPRDEPGSETNDARTLIRVSEGPQYHFGRITAVNNREIAESEILDESLLQSGDIYVSKRVQQAVQAIQELYRKNGYDDVVVSYSQVKDASLHILAVNFNVQENYQHILREVTVENNQKTSTGLIRSQIELEPGDVITYEKLSQARVKLYSTGSYSFVEIVSEPSDDKTGMKPNQTAVRLRVRVRELEPWQLKYGGYYNTDNGPGGVFDFSNRNMLGNSRIVGMQVRYDSDLREARLYVTQPSIRRFPVKGLFSAFKRREIITSTITIRDPLTNTSRFANGSTLTYKTGVSPTFEYRYRKNNVVTLGYRFEKAHAFRTEIDTAITTETRTRIGGLTSSITRDTRDDPIDASRGRFNAHSLEWSPSFLGSQQQMIKYFGQYFAYFPFGKPSKVPWAGVTRNRLVGALGTRVGMARGFGGNDILETERFLSGGGTTVRGFDQNKLGPLDSSGFPLGGAALLVLNAELRFPLYRFFDGVTFVDAGNVYAKVSKFSLGGMRESAGVGIRIRTPYIVIRLDYGLKVNKKPEERIGRFFFSIGQAF